MGYFAGMVDLLNIEYRTRNNECRMPKDKRYFPGNR